MPNDRLKINQIMTTGAKPLPIFEVPRGWIRKRRMRMAQDVPTIVGLVISDLTTSKLQAALIAIVRSLNSHVKLTLG